MKKILLGAAFVFAFLPQVSFATETNPDIIAFDNQEGVKVLAFFQQQAAERDAWGKQHADVLAKHDKHFKAALDIDMARRNGKPTTGLPPVPDDDVTFSAFVQKQQNDKQAFFAQVNKDKQAFLDAHPGLHFQ